MRNATCVTSRLCVLDRSDIDRHEPTACHSVSTCRVNTSLLSVSRTAELRCRRVRAHRDEKSLIWEFFLIRCEVLGQGCLYVQIVKHSETNL